MRADIREEALWFGPSLSDLAEEATIGKCKSALRDCKSLEQFEDDGWTLEMVDRRGPFDRYTVLETGLHFWACSDCGSIGVDPNEGCVRCGLGQEQDDE